MNYEYQVLVQGDQLELDINVANPDTVALRCADRLVRLAPRLSNPLEDGTDWEVVSHSIFPIGQTLVTTVLLRRQIQ